MRPAGAEVIDCRGAIVAPGLVDMRVFVGEPGAEHRETFASAGQAAAAGGVTSIVTMPDTDPVIDDVALVDFIGRRARDETAIRVHPMAAITKGLRRPRDDRVRPPQGRRRGRLHRRAAHRDQRRRDAPRADLCPRLRRADHAPAGRPAPHRRRRDERGRGRLPARPRRHPEGGRDHRRRARHAARGADPRALPRRPDLLRRVARGGAPRQGGRDRHHLRRVDQPPDAQRERHRPLPDLLQARAAAPLRRRPAGDDRRHRRRHDRRDRLEPRPAGRRHQAPALRRGRRRRGRAGDACCRRRSACSTPATSTS